MTSRHSLRAITLLFLSALPVAAEPPAPAKTNISLLEYGARFDGVTDDTEAWKRAIKDALSGPWGAVIKVPAGRSVVSETLAVEITGNEGLAINDVSIHGGSGGSILTAGSCWRDGMVFKDQTTLRITDTAIRFSRVSPVGTGITISGDRSKSRLVSDHHLENVRIQWGEVGISVCKGDANFEGLMIMNSTIVGSRRAAILADNGGSYSGQLTVTGCHINAGEAAIKTNGILEVGLCNNYIIAGQSPSPRPLAVGFHFKNTASMTITGNLFNFNPENPAGGWGIIVDCDEKWGGRKIPAVIANNSIFNPPTGGLSFRNHATHILVNGNSIVTAGKPVEVAGTAKVNVGINQINGEMVNGLDKK